MSGKLATAPSPDRPGPCFGCKTATLLVIQVIGGAMDGQRMAYCGAELCYDLIREVHDKHG